jgi:hypothetical protein
LADLKIEIKEEGKNIILELTDADKEEVKTALQMVSKMYGPGNQEPTSIKKDIHKPDRVVNGKELYNTKYSCPCGNSGNRYCGENDTYTKCHECKKLLELEPSTENSFRDDEGYVFKAEKLYEEQPTATPVY